jgi:hypothetical protein
MSQWWFLAFAMFVTIPVALGFAFSNQIYAWYLYEFVEADLERDLGFHGGTVTVENSERPYEWYGILSVTRGGEFDRAGVRPGDFPTGYVHGVRSGFIANLHAARGSSVTITFASARITPAHQEKLKRVKITVPSKRPG